MGITTIVKNTDTKQDHTYDAAEFHTHTNNIDEHPQYNTLQRENTANAQTISNPTFDAYDRIDINTSKDVQKCSNLSMQFQRSTQMTDSVREYDEVDTNHAQRENQPQICESEIDWTHQAIPLDYEPVYYGPNSTQGEESTGEHALFDDNMYGTHKPASKRATVRQGKEVVECTCPNAHSKTTTIVMALSDNRSTAHQEVKYAKPQPIIKSHTQELQTKIEHFYYSLDHNEPMEAEEHNSGVPYSIESLNPLVKGNTFASNNQYTSAELAELPTRNNVNVMIADTKRQTKPLTSLSDSIQTLDEVGTTNAPILFNIDQCEFDDPMYEGVTHSIPKPSMSSDLINEKMQTVQHVLSQEEVSCKDMNTHPELQNHEKDTKGHANAPEYSDPVVLECVNDKMANDQREAKDPKVDIYDMFDDPTYA